VGPISREALDRLFATSALLSAIAFGIAWFATRGEPLPTRRRRPALFSVMRRYHPGIILLVAAAVGVGLHLPNTFLRTFAAERGIPAIGVFFGVYAVTAFVVRLWTRTLFTKYGNRLWVLCGLASLVVSLLLYLTVHRPWQLAIPGAFAGIAHAVLFPAVVASGSTSFPVRHRGLATTLMLSMFDLGNLFGAPLVGGILHFSRPLGLPAYPTMLLSVVTVFGLVALAFALLDRPRRGRSCGERRRAPQTFVIPWRATPAREGELVALPAPHASLRQPVAAQPVVNER
jgi:predicted MFS family arabinose efflux permease